MFDVAVPPAALLALGLAALGVGTGLVAALAWHFYRCPGAAVQEHLAEMLADATTELQSMVRSGVAQCTALSEAIQIQGDRIARERARVQTERARIEDPKYGHRNRRGGDGHRPTNGVASEVPEEELGALEKWLRAQE